MCLWMYGGQQRHQVALSVTLHLIVWDGVSPCMWKQQSAGPADQPPGLSSLHLCLTLCPTLDPRAREQRFMLVKQALPPYLLLTNLPTGLLSSKLAPKKIVLSPWGVWVIKELTYGLARVTVSWPYMQQLCVVACSRQTVSVCRKTCCKWVFPVFLIIWQCDCDILVTVL